MSKHLIGLMVLCCALPVAQAGGTNGLIVKKSPVSARATVNRLEAVLQKKDIQVFARVHHQQNAANAGIQIRPTELLIFGNPKLGSHFFTSQQTAGIDLPMKVLAWEDAKGQTWLAYNDPAYIAKRHGVYNRADIVKKMQEALDNLTDKALQP